MRLERLAGARQHRDRDVLFDGEEREDVRHLESASHPRAHPRAGGEPRHLGAGEDDAARVGRELSREQIDERRLACAVGPDDRGHAPAGQLEVDAVDRLELGE